jgi:PDZ domain
MLSLESKANSRPERGWWLNEPASDRKAFGMVLHLIEGDWRVARTLVGSPAEKAGVAAGERLASVDGYEVGEGRGDMYELQQLMILDSSGSNLLTFRSRSGDINRNIEKLPLRQLLEFDYDNGGAHLAACVGCRTCRPLTIGATDCSSGCPGNYCTVG